MSPGGSKRRRRRLGLQAAAVVYLPQALPFFAGPLMECSSHCLPNYLKLFPVLPGFLLGWLAGGGGFLLYFLAGACTLGVLSALFAVLKLRSGLRWLLVLLAAALAAANSMGVAALLRQ